MNGPSEIGDSPGSKPASDSGLTETPVIDRIPRLTTGKKKNRKPPRPTLETPRTQILLPRTRKGWLQTAGIAVGSIVVVAAALFGIRFISDTGCSEFTTEVTTVQAGGLKVNVLPGDLVGSFGIKMSVLEPTQFGSSAGGADVQTAAGAIPQNLTPLGNYVAVKTCSVNPKNITLRMAVPAEVQSLDSFDLYGWMSPSKTWRWLGGEVDSSSREIVAHTNEMPSGLMLMKTAPTTPILGVDAPTVATAAQTWQSKLPASAAEASVPVMILGDRGRLNVFAENLPAAGSVNARVIPSVRNWGANGEVNRTLLRNMLSSDGARDSHISQLLAALDATGYEALEIDYRGVEAAYATAYADFIDMLARKLGEHGKQLNVVVPLPEIDGSGVVAAPGYDLRRIGNAANLVKLDLTANPAVMMSAQLGNVIGWTTGQVNRYKLQLVVPATSVRQDANGRTMLMSLDSAMAGLAPLGADVPAVRPGATVQLKWRAGASPAKVNYDAETNAYCYSYIDERGIQQTVWLGTAASLKSVLLRLSNHNVRGITLRGVTLDGNDEGVAQVVDSYVRGGLNDVAVPEPKVKVAFGTGTPFSLPLNATAGDMQVQAPGGEGTYTLQSVFESGRQVVVGALPVQVSKDAPPALGGAETATASAAVTATGEISAAVVQQAATPGAVNGVNADKFELGGYVNDLSHITQMQGAGMTWIKTEVRGTDAPADFIAAAKAKGMKVLVTAIGDRVRVMDEGYRAEWAQSLGRLAALGVDAIEVWSEPNYDGNWPSGQVNGQTYAELLKAAYTAIKQANPNTLVISAGLAQTAGAYSGGCDEHGCDELAFMSQMAAANAKDSMDCIGIHYTTGHEAPNAVGANHYSWYYEPLRSAYYGAFGGAKPVCFTALGYVTAEGFQGGMPTNYAFAAGTTLANHAAWLADAAKMSKDSGKVRLMIVWNVDATLWRGGDDGDPAAGYAIIRPDGTCPACESLRTVMGSQ